jgi:prevent-host-death family protein
MTTVEINEAKTQLSQLIARAEAGEEIIIARGDRPVVRLIPIAKAKPKRAPGTLKDKITLPDEFFFDPLPEGETRAWEGDEETPR